jgi:hypothetical protein
MLCAARVYHSAPLDRLRHSDRVHRAQGFKLYDDFLKESRRSLTHQMVPAHETGVANIGIALAGRNVVKVQSESPLPIVQSRFHLLR